MDLFLCLYYTCSLVKQPLDAGCSLLDLGLGTDHIRKPITDTKRSFIKQSIEQETRWLTLKRAEAAAEVTLRGRKGRMPGWALIPHVHQSSQKGISVAGACSVESWTSAVTSLRNEWGKGKRPKQRTVLGASLRNAEVRECEGLSRRRKGKGKAWCCQFAVRHSVRILQSVCVCVCICVRGTRGGQRSTTSILYPLSHSPTSMILFLMNTHTHIKDL